ncbi:MAG TPA: hypothetical protein VJB98_00090 [Candidatus Paceibacterota bacterium]
MDRILRQLDSPKKIQDYLDKLKVNFEKSGETCMSPLRVVREGKAHCMEGALFAAAVLGSHGYEPMIMHLRTHEDDTDQDHAVALFKDGKNNKYWGAISKTNHAVLRYRDPIYVSVRELALSYFHEYFDKSGRKTLRYYSRPFSLKKFGKSWVTSEKDLWHIDDAFNNSKHFPILPKNFKANNLRKASKLEIKAGDLVEYKS